MTWRKPRQAKPGPSRGDPVIGRQVVCFVLSSAISALPGEARPGPARPGQARPGRPWEEAILTLFATLGRPWEPILTLFATLLYRIDTASHELGNPGRPTPRDFVGSRLKIDNTVEDGRSQGWKP